MADDADPRLRFLRQEQAAKVDIAGDIVPIGDRWAIHGTLPLEGEMILGEFDTYEQARAALHGLDPEVPAPIESTVGHEDGWLVLQFERRLPQPPDEVWTALSSAEHREHGIPCGLSEDMPTGTTVTPMVFEWCPGPDTVRWEVDHLDDGSRLALTTWIDSDDPDVAAGTGAGYHSCFEQLVRVLEAGPDGVLGPCSDVDTLIAQYLAALAASDTATD